MYVCMYVCIGYIRMYVGMYVGMYVTIHVISFEIFLNTFSLTNGEYILFLIRITENPYLTSSVLLKVLSDNLRQI